MTIADIPFERKDPLQLLDLDTVGFDFEPDPDFAGFGWSMIPRLTLASRDAGCEPVHLMDVLCLGLHSSDEAHASIDDIDLCFALQDDDGDLDIVVPLSTFLEKRLPGLVEQTDGTCTAIVLSLCNPYDVLVGRPHAAGRLPVYFSTGDVRAFLPLEFDHAGLPTQFHLEKLQLEGQRWYLV